MLKHIQRLEAKALKTQKFIITEQRVFLHTCTSRKKATKCYPFVQQARRKTKLNIMSSFSPFPCCQGVHLGKTTLIKKQ